MTSGDNIDYFAPIAIPTLNRYEHLKRCIDSLEKCTWVEHTELFVSIDFPPDEKYREGYEKVVGYINTKDWKAFKQVHIYNQNQNLGAKKNIRFLYDIIKQSFECCIFTEDDNEFMPSYLVFINRGIRNYLEDPLFYNMCGYSRINADHQGYAKIPSATWGSATAFRNREKASSCIQDIFLNGVLSYKDVRKIYRRSTLLFKYYIEFLISQNEVYFNTDGSIASIDITVGIYLILNDLYSVVPTQSLVKNWGYDGSGINCDVVEDFDDDLVLDRSLFFDFSEEYYVESKELVKVYTKRDKEFYKYLIKYLLIRLIGVERVRKILGIVN